MTALNSIVRFLNKELQVRKIKDGSKNGLQVRGGSRVEKIGFAVDGTLETFKKAKKAGIDLLIVHHGIIWKKFRDKMGLKKERIRFLKKNKISLYACHLPLDIHEKYGNNIVLVKILGLRNIKKFGRYHGIPIGYEGKFKKSIPLKKIKLILDRKLRTKSKLLNFGKSKVKTIGIVSGGGAACLSDAVKEKLDCFLTGEVNHVESCNVRDLKINMIISGHYATETVGVKALMPVLREKFGVRTVFLNLPIGA